MWLINNVVLVSRVQPSVSVIHTHVSVLFSKFFSHLSCFIILNKVSCAMLVIHFLVGEGATLSLHCGPRALWLSIVWRGRGPRSVFTVAHGLFVAHRLSLVVHGGFSLVVLWGFCCSAHRLPICGMQPLECVSSVVAMCRLSGPAACGILVHPPRMKPATPALEGGFSITESPGKSP